MTLKIPSPASIKEEKKKRLHILFMAQQNLPLLTERLSRGTIIFDDARAWRWAGWMEALLDSPAWPVLAPTLASPGSWPEVWALARDEGFADSAHHFNALFFQSLFEEALEDGQQDLAREAWEQALLSWARLKDGVYLQEEILGPMASELSEAQVQQALGSLLDYPISSLQTLATQALRLSPWEKFPLRRPLVFVHEAASRLKEIFSDGDSPLINGALKSLQDAQNSVQEALITAFDKVLSELDLTSIKTAQIEELFDAFIIRNDLLYHPPELDRFFLRRGLALIWDLREIGRDEELLIIDALAPRLKPSAARLRSSDESTRFGIEGAIADLDVFIGEEALAIDTRQAAFEAALEVCPGHRNASRMLSYLLLERANRQLLKTSALPAATTRLGLLRRQVKPILQEAQALIERAEELFPENDLLNRYQNDFFEEWRRFKLDEESTDED